MQTKVPHSVLTLKSRMRRLYMSWWTTHYAIGLLGVLAGTLLTALTSADAPSHDATTAMLSLASLKAYSWLIGIVAAVCTSLVTFLGPISKAERYWSAYHLLDQACLEYDQDMLTTRRFLSRVKQARTVLQVSDPADHSTQDQFSSAEADTQALEQKRAA
jgi:hypothetical protein